MGIFRIIDEDISSNGRPIYKNNDDQYLHYWDSDEKWLIGSSYDNANAEVKSSKAYGCPAEVEDSSWEFIDTSWKTGSLAVDCFGM